MSSYGKRRVGGSDVAKHSWAGGVAERIGRKRKKEDSDDDSDEDEENNSRIVRGYYTSSYHSQNSSNNGSNNSSDLSAGVIEKLNLENFMCHSSLVWTPNTRINFVTGQNGAGKSSVLQGRVVTKVFEDFGGGLCKGSIIEGKGCSC